MVGKGDASRVEHLQKEIPYQPMRLFDFIEQENALPVRGENFAQASGSAGFVTHEQLHGIEMKELRHIESEYGVPTEKVAGKFQCQLGLAYAGRPEKQERAKRFAERLQTKLTAFQDGGDAGNDMALSLYLGSKMRF